jgi:hypothetical protein
MSVVFITDTVLVTTTTVRGVSFFLIFRLKGTTMTHKQLIPVVALALAAMTAMLAHSIWAHLP